MWNTNFSQTTFSHFLKPQRNSEWEQVKKSNVCINICVVWKLYLFCSDNPNAALFSYENVPMFLRVTYRIFSISGSLHFNANMYVCVFFATLVLCDHFNNLYYEKEKLCIHDGWIYFELPIWNAYLIRTFIDVTKKPYTNVLKKRVKEKET